MFLKTLKVWSILVLILFCSLSETPVKGESLPASPAQKTYVVNGGGQQAIEQALRQAKAGDTIVVKAGNYDNGDPLKPLVITASGQANAPLKLMGEGRPKLGTLRIINSRYFELAGFEISHQKTKKFMVGLHIQDSSDIVIRDMLIHDLSGSAINLYGTGQNILVENSTLYELVPPAKATDAHCLVNSTIKNVTFRHSKCYGFIGDGYHAWRVDSSKTYDRGTTRLEGNEIYNTKGTCSENAIDVKGEDGELIIRGNALHGFRKMDQSQCQIYATGCYFCPAITAHDSGDGSLVLENNQIFNSDAGLINEVLEATIQNNLLYDLKDFAFYDRGPTSSYLHNTVANTKALFHQKSNSAKEAVNNLFYNAGSTVKGQYSYNGWFGKNSRQKGKNDVTGSDPKLTSSYVPKAGSPVIDRGIDRAINTDLTGMLAVRPIGSAPDLGAFEYGGDSKQFKTQEPGSTPAPLPFATPEVEGPSLTLDLTPVVVSGETFEVQVAARGLPAPGVYGVQFELSFDPAMVKVDQLQLDESLSLAVLNKVDNQTGQIRVVASRQGTASGLSGDVTLLTFQATAGNLAGTTDFTFVNVKLSDPTARPMAITPRQHTVEISGGPDLDSGEKPASNPTDPADPGTEIVPIPNDGYDNDGATESPAEPPQSPSVATVLGQVFLAGRTANQWAGVEVKLGGAEARGLTDLAGDFSLDDITLGDYPDLVADAPGYLPAACASVAVADLETRLQPVTLLSGDINDDGVVDIADATAVGAKLGLTETETPADLNLDAVVDIFDIVLISYNFGKEGTQPWRCQ